MSTKVVILIFLVFALVSANTFTKKNMRQVRKINIAKGSLAAAGELGHQVAIIDIPSNSQYCGGTLVTSQWVVCAAHCFEGTAANTVQVWAGQIDLTKTATKSNAAQIIMHPNYDSVNIVNDISLIKLATPIAQTANIKYANLDKTASIPIGTNLIVSGWGLTEGGDSSLQLRKVTVPLTPGSPYCSQYGTFSNTAMLCAGDGSGRDACPGDSGGPLGRFINGTFYLSGITSWGPADCGFANSYGAYTRVYNYISWIENYIPELKNRTVTPVTPATSAPKPTTSAPKPATSAPKPATSAPKPTTSAPKPTTNSPKTSAPTPTTSAPKSNGTTTGGTSNKPFIIFGAATPTANIGASVLGLLMLVLFLLL